MPDMCSASNTSKHVEYFEVRLDMISFFFFIYNIQFIRVYTHYRLPLCRIAECGGGEPHTHYRQKISDQLF